MGSRLEACEGTLEIVRRDVLISNPGTYGIPDEQLHFPYLYESVDGIWYLTYREGPHLEEVWKSAGNRVRCVQSRDRGKTWLPWMGMEADPHMFQFFVTRLLDGSLISYRFQMTGLHEARDGTLEGTAIVLRSAGKGAAWHKESVPVTNMPFHDNAYLVSLWGHAIVMPDGRLLWGIISRERNPAESLCGLVESIDGGRTFRFLSVLSRDVFKDVGEPREPGIVLLPSGDLLAVIRCTPMIQVRSSDGGRTWSAPRRLVRAGVCPQLLRLDNGVLTCAYGTRKDVHIMASWDGTGRKWSDPLVVYEGQTSGYSNLQPLAADRFRLSYQEGTFDEFQPGGNRIVRTEVRACSL